MSDILSIIEKEIKVKKEDKIVNVLFLIIFPDELHRDNAIMSLILSGFEATA